MHWIRTIGHRRRGGGVLPSPESKATLSEFVWFWIGSGFFIMFFSSEEFGLCICDNGFITFWYTRYGFPSISAL